MTYRGPKRRQADKLGDGTRVWTVSDHRHFEQGLGKDLEDIRGEMAGLRSDLIKLATRVSYLLGSLLVVGFVASAILSAYIASTIHH